MDISYLREFFVFSQTLNVSEAARRMHISQPTMSKHIAALEREIGCPLVTREQGSLSLTWEGRALAAGAADLTKSYSELIAKVKAGHQKTFELRIAYAYTHTSSHVNIAVVRNKFYGQHSDFEFVYAGECGPNVHETLADEQIDCALTPFGLLAEDAAAGIKCVHCPEYVPNRLFLNVSTNSFIADRESASLDDLRQLRILLPLNAGLYYRSLGERLASYGIEHLYHSSTVLSDYYDLLPNEATIIDEVHSTYPSVRSVPNRVLIPVDEVGLREASYIAYRPSRISPALGLFLDFLEGFKDLTPDVILPATE